MRRVSKRILSSVLTGAMLLSLISSSALAAEPITEPEESPQSNGMTYEDRDAIESIQATVVDSFYGYKVGSVEITYQPGTDLRDVENGTYTVWDRGFNNPEFGKLKITDTQVDDNVVTLIVDEGTDKVTDRTRETYGTLCTSSNWYIDNKGYVHYDGMEKDSIGKEILPNDINKGLQWRNLDLILTIDDQPVYDGIFSTDGVGNMLPDDMTVWEEPILPDGLDEVVLEMVDVGWEAEGYTQVNEQEGTEGLVPVQVIYPEGYDANRAEPYPTIVYQCGGGVCYWEDNGEYAANNLNAFYSAYQGAAQHLPNGNVLVTSTATGHLFEVTQDKRVVWEYVSPFMSNGEARAMLTENDATADPEGVKDINLTANVIHRAFRYAPDYSGLAGRDLSKKIVVFPGAPKWHELFAEAARLDSPLNKR